MINYLPGRNVYPTFEGESLGQIASGQDIGPTPGEVEAGVNGEVDAALRVGGQANPLVGLLVFVLLVAAIGFIAHRFGEAGAFSNIKANAYNALFISLVAVAGIPIWKAVFTFFKVPGASTWVQSV